MYVYVKLSHSFILAIYFKLYIKLVTQCTLLSNSV